MSAFVKQLLRDYRHLDEAYKLDLDVAINDLKSAGELTEEEQKILYFLRSEFSLRETSKLLNLDYSTFMRRIKTLCRKLSAVLGDEYDDAHILSLVEARLGRGLSSKEKKFCLWMITKYGYKIMGAINIYSFEKWLK
jgi:hypothetical protein